MQINQLTHNEAEVKLEVKFNLSNSNEVKKVMLELIDQGINKVILDFGDTEEIDSSGLGKILFFAETLRESGGSLKLVNIQSPELRKLFQLIQLDKILDSE